MQQKINSTKRTFGKCEKTEADSDSETAN